MSTSTVYQPLLAPIMVALALEVNRVSLQHDKWWFSADNEILLYSCNPPILGDNPSIKTTEMHLSAILLNACI